MLGALWVLNRWCPLPSSHFVAETELDSKWPSFHDQLNRISAPRGHSFIHSLFSHSTSIQAAFLHTYHVPDAGTQLVELDYCLLALKSLFTCSFSNIHGALLCALPGGGECCWG